MGGMALGACWVFAGKLMLGYMYGLGLTSGIGIGLLINVMSSNKTIDLYRTMSILGYGLLPMVLLAFVGIFMSLKGKFGLLASLCCIGWSTAVSSQFFAVAMSLPRQRWLV